MAVATYYIEEGKIRKMKITSLLYKLARLFRDFDVTASGDPKKVARRAKNKWLGKNVISKLFKW